jgi:hypothetical protein
MKRKPSGPTCRNLVVGAALTALVLGCEQDPYERAAKCEQLISEGNECAEVADEEWCKKRVEILPSKYGTVANCLDSEPCMRWNHELWSEQEQLRLRTCELFLEDFERGCSK